MAMITPVACLAALLSVPLHGRDARPQGPPDGLQSTTQGPATSTDIPFASALPNSTIAVLAVDDLAPHLEALSKTALYQLASLLELPAQLTEGVSRLQTQATNLTGLDRETLLRAASNGATLALTGVDERGRPELMLCFRLGEDIGVFEQAIAKVTSSSRPHSKLVTATTQGETPIWTLRNTGDFRPSFCLHRDSLLASTSAQSLADVIKRREAGGPSLADDPAFREFTKRTAAGGSPFGWGYVKSGQLLAGMLPQLTGADSVTARKALKALELGQLETIGYAIWAGGGKLHDHLRIRCSEPRSGLLGTLFDSGAELTPSAVTNVPPGVASFAVVHVNLPAIYDEIGKLLSTVQPSLWASLTRGLDALNKNVGVNLEHDVINALGEEIVTLQWPSAGDETNVAILIEAHDTWKLGGAVTRLITAVGGGLEPLTWRGHKIYRLAETGPVSAAKGLRYSLTETHLVVASSEDAMRNSLAQLESPDQNAHAADLVERLPNGARWASWTDIGEGTNSLIKSFETQSHASPAAMRQLRKTLGKVQGSMEHHLALDSHGFSIRSSSPVGNLYAAGVLGVAAAAAAPSLTLDSLAAGAEMVKPDSGLRSAMALIVAAQSKMHHGTGHYGDLDELVKAGYLQAASIGEVVGDGVLQRGDYRLTVLVPAEGSERRKFYAAIAWPTEKRTGTVVAATPLEPMLINEAIAASLGIRVATVPDLFLSGRFGTTKVPGWRVVDDATLVSTHTGDRALFEAILAAEQLGRANVPRAVIDAMQAANPTVAARAAYALGQLKVVAAIPELCDAVANHTDDDVKRQAMAALKNIGDARSLQTSINALADDDALLRALAAANIGQFEDKSAAPALLSVVSSDQGTGELRDRVAAVLALTDIGADDTLLQVAAAVTTESKQLVEALTYMFQSLCPQLDQATETKVLLAVVGHSTATLRLYAAQRLGQRRDVAALQPLRDRVATESNPKVRAALEQSLRAIGSARVSTRTAASGQTPGPGLWGGLSPTQRGLVSGGGIGIIVMLGGLAFWRGRRRRSEDSQAGGSQGRLTDAYTGYEDEEEEEGEYDDYADEDYADVDEQGDFADGDDADFAEGDGNDQGHFDGQVDQPTADQNEAGQPSSLLASGLWDATVDVGEDFEAAIEEEE